MFLFFFKQKTAYEMLRSLVGSEMCIRDRRETYRTHRAELAEDAHIVFVARPAAVALDYAECEQAIRQLLRKGGLLSG